MALLKNVKPGKRVFAIFLFLTILCGIAPAQEKRKSNAVAGARPKPAAHLSRLNTASDRFAAVESVVLSAIAHGQIPGAVLVVGHGGRVVYRRAFGMRSLEPRREAMTLDTVFDVASLTKCVVTAMSVMRMVELGQVRLNDPVAKYIPEFGSNGKDQITIRQLAT
ncbi:MAG TPA: serine hydrolase domain-containing protein, partial [Clostridia bacterium]|nr:serine hydrolase domain-containing protein [Clostridia bacterium]